MSADWSDPTTPGTVLDFSKAPPMAEPLELAPGVEVFQLAPDPANPTTNLLLLVTSGGTLIAFDGAALGLFYDYLTTLTAQAPVHA